MKGVSVVLAGSVQADLLLSYSLEPACTPPNSDVLHSSLFPLFQTWHSPSRASPIGGDDARAGTALSYAPP